MTSIRVHRQDKELTGKALSANTLASFLAAQQVRSVADLATGRAMSTSLLHFLNRRKALEYWQSNGWLRREPSGTYLTEAGLDEVELRESGQAVNANGRRKSGNIDPMQVAAALRFIETGQLDETEAEVSVLLETFVYRIWV
ncbi:hypothetical protein E4634_16020 [Mangrovimicrobium sediminis]|uniref:Uncharacterized protein n=1 Tax=Mangrovimicrobium sediminis TaxID=2562682 RepID=A0A4Z0LXS0_9GAMM|nr:hypothetical protein [Haliea sp. SAOS-164]TGD72173.1 hypothetical protein E4634_16020 [Haliea sp. SAOS-164]